MSEFSWFSMKITATNCDYAEALGFSVFWDTGLLDKAIGELSCQTDSGPRTVGHGQQSSGCEVAQFETFSAYFSRVLTPEALVFGLILMGLTLPFANWGAKRLQISLPRFALIAVSVIGVISLSIRYWDRVGTANHFWLFDITLWASALNTGANWILNVALYVPAAMLLVLARQSPWKVFLFLLALSALIETVQLVTTFGNGDPADFVANATGSVLGILLALAAGRLMPRLLSQKEPISEIQ